VASLAREGSDALRSAGIPTPAQDAEVLLAHLLGVPRALLHADPAGPVGTDLASRYRTLVARRAARVPLQHLTGFQEFWSLRFEVTPEVLIPRPETEHLIEVLLRVARAADSLVLDIGTGSGCLAVVAAREIRGAVVHATDLSPGALAVARRNAAAHGVADRVTFHEGSLFEPLRGKGLEGRAAAILSNPPYLGETELAGLEPEVRMHEPREALSPGPDALAVHRRIAAEAAAFLAPGGHLIVEIGQGQEVAARALYGGAGGIEVVQVVPDLAGIPRVLVARNAPG